MDAEKQQIIREHFVQLFNNAPIKKSMGMDLHYNDEGQAVFELPRNPKFDHALHDVHGGVIATLLDNAGWFTIAAYYGCWVVTVEFHVRLLEPAKQEDLKSIGRIVRTGNRLGMAQMEVRSKDDRLVAIGSGTFATTSKLLIQ